MSYTQSFTVTAEAMISPPGFPWWKRVWLWVRRKPTHPPLIQPEGTVPVWIDTPDDGVKRRIYIPAARITWDSDTP